MEELEVPCCIRGYHVYKDIWTARIGEHFDCIRQPTNSSDRYAVAVIKDAGSNRQIIGHLPRKISKFCSLFLRRGGSITCTVSGNRRNSFDLPQGGLEVPCRLILKAEAKEITKMKKYVT